LKVCAFEITDKICNGVKKRMKNFGVNVDIRVGRNSNVPFDSEYFDYVVASSSLYYVDHGENFNANLAELARVTKRGGYIILTLAHPKTFVLKDAIEVEDSHFEITKDPYNLRNGDIFYVFKDKTAIVDKFSRYFDDICIGQQNEDYYGMNIRLWLVVAKRK
jgi:ubiquinone/menaquinone biosynthesis C-methylase UbiE